MKRARQPCFRLPVSGDEVVRMALAAYYRAGAEATAPIDDPDPVGWSDAETFLTSLFDLFELRLRCEAAAAGHGVDCDQDRWKLVQSRKPYRDLHISEVDPETWAEMQAGVGAAHGDAFDPLSADPLLLASAGQQLPPVTTPDHTETEGARP